MNSIQLASQLLCQLRLAAEIITRSQSSGEEAMQCLSISLFIMKLKYVPKHDRPYKEKCPCEPLIPLKAAVPTQLCPPSPGDMERIGKMEQRQGTPTTHIGHQPDRDPSWTT